MAVDVGSYAKCSAAVMDKGANLMGGIMVITGIMAIVLVLSGLFHSVLRRMGQPSVISHILVRRYCSIDHQPIDSFISFFDIFEIEINQL